ncbi:MAG: WD40/YVTN/BNR-like repeat-containing protein [Hyphomonadaceae bacterium]
MRVACLSTNGANHFSFTAPVEQLFVATTNGVVVIERTTSGAWRRIRDGLSGSHVSGMAVQQRAGKILAACMPGTLMGSSDGGVTWDALIPDLPEVGAYSVRCFEGADKTRIYVGTQPVGLYRSDDGGVSWVDLASVRSAPMHDKWRFPAPGHLPHLKTLTVDPRNSDVIYAGVEQGALLKSIDGGRTWVDLDQFVDYDNFVYKDIHQVVLRPTKPNEVFITTGLGLYHSQDEGATWRQLTDDKFRIGYPDQLLFAPDNDQHLFVSGGFAIPYHWVEAKSAKGTIMLSKDGGKNWRAPAKGFPEGRSNVEAMTICGHADGYDIFAGTTDGEVYMSADRGESWALIVEGLAPVSKPTHDVLINGVAYENDLRP